jgi:hypothetical protein
MAISLVGSQPLRIQSENRATGMPMAAMIIPRLLSIGCDVYHSWSVYLFFPLREVILTLSTGARSAFGALVI